MKNVSPFVLLVAAVLLLFLVTAKAPEPEKCVDKSAPAFVSSYISGEITGLELP